MRLWHRMDEVPTESDWRGGMTMAEDVARKGQGLHRNVYHLNEYLLCKVRIMELNEVPSSPETLSPEPCALDPQT